jgi:hypothetical protein
MPYHIAGRYTIDMIVKNFYEMADRVPDFRANRRTPNMAGE